MESYCKLTKEQKLKLMDATKIDNIMNVPRLLAIVVSISTKDLVTQKSLLKDLESQISLITGQKPITTYARKSISNFKLRQKAPIGLKVTLRSKMMNDFFYKLNTIIFPRIRDFKGFSPKSFDGQGNFNIGIKEIIFFPEIDYDKIKKIYGINISFVTSAKNDSDGLALFKLLNFPFYKKGGIK